MNEKSLGRLTFSGGSSDVAFASLAVGIHEELVATVRGFVGLVDDNSDDCVDLQALCGLVEAARKTLSKADGEEQRRITGQIMRSNVRELVASDGKILAWVRGMDDEAIATGDHMALTWNCHDELAGALEEMTLAFAPCPADHTERSRAMTGACAALAKVNGPSTGSGQGE